MKRFLPEPILSGFFFLIVRFLKKPMQLFFGFIPASVRE